MVNSFNYTSWGNTRQLSLASKSGLVRLLREEGVSLRMQAITPEDEQKAAKLYESGMTIHQVEEFPGINMGRSEKCFMKMALLYDPVMLGAVTQ